MNWIQQNWTTVLLIVVFLGFFFRGPILARIYDIENITVHDLSKKLEKPSEVVLVDVRTLQEYQSGHIKQSVHIPMGDLSAQLEQLKAKHAGKEVALICLSGSRSMMASVTLKKGGIEKVYNVSGGMSHWQSQGYPVTK
ncbi:rhodanese-like domain-containing protein [Magnetococcales bacterium HHB-1]